MDDRTVFFSPIPPVKSGTADYFDAFLKCLGTGVHDVHPLIICDFDFLPRPPPSSFHGIRVIDYRSFSPRPTDRIFMFLANNEFHGFCYKFLTNPRCAHTLISILHDPQILMFLTAVCVGSQFGFEKNDLEHLVSTEFGALTPLFADARQDGHLPEIFYYTTLAQTLALRDSSEVWLHSFYGVSKLLLENQHPAFLPPIRVIQHPHGDTLSHTARNKPAFSPDFVVGMFGFLGPLKRNNEVVLAFHHWLQGLSPDDRNHTRLFLVGKLPPRDYYDPVGLVEQLGLQDRVQFTGFVSLDELEHNLATCSVVFNLRFPSCGETSGTMQRTRDFGIPIATSAYGSFHEEPSDFKCAILPDEEQRDIIAVLDECWRTWKAFGTTQTLSKAPECSYKKTNARDAFYRCLQTDQSERIPS